MVKSVNENVEKKEFNNTARWTVTTVSAQVANSLSETVLGALFVGQWLRHYPRRRAPWSPKFLRRQREKSILKLILLPFGREYKLQDGFFPLSQKIT